MPPGMPALGGERPRAGSGESNAPVAADAPGGRTPSGDVTVPKG